MKFHTQFLHQEVQKTYLALCEGEHPATRACSDPILRVCHKLGICRVDAELGKPAHTDFVLLHYNPDTNRSLVLCKPKSGRMHQIRVHLAHHGFPIPNDPIYAHENWAKKSTDEFSKELSDALFKGDNFKDKLHEIRGVSGDGIKASSDIQVTSDQEFLIGGKLYQPMPQFDYDALCPECKVTRLIPQPEDMFIYLHAVRYELDNKVFCSPLPPWCEEQWVPAEHRQYLGLQ